MTSSPRWLLPAMVVMHCAWPGSAAAQGGEKSVGAIRIEAPPTVNGQLDDAAWQHAEVIDDFRQRDPNQGAPGSERTSVRIVYDRNALYIGAVLEDREPDQIIGRALRRDSSFDSDDYFSVIIDTFHDHRNAFVFSVNPNGAMFDGIVRNEAGPDSDWDEQWYAAVSTGPAGWTVELQIPFKTLRFAKGRQGAWGIDFERIIRRKNEEVYWANHSRNFDFEQVSQAGMLTGLDDIQQAQRFRLRPYATAGVEALPASDANVLRGSVGVGLDDLRIAVTPNLTADVAVNPDFAQTEADQRRVNLTRFNLFFPEKRRFFVEGAGSLRMRPPDDFGDDTLELFHSRRIGLSDSGAPTPLVAGAKLTGKIAGTDLGVLGARTATSGGSAAETFGVVRFQRELFTRSYIGAIATTRDGPDGMKSTIGADAQFVLKRYLRVSMLGAGTDDSSGSRKWAHLFGATWDSDFFEARAAHVSVQPGFDPAVGYVRRNDRQLQLGFSLKPRPRSGPVRQFSFSPSFVAHHDTAGTLLTREMEVEVETEFQSGDEIEVSVGRTSERLPEPFEITDGILLPDRRYDWTTAAVDVRTFDGRAISGSVSYEQGGFYSGRRRTFELSPTVRSGRHLSLAPSYQLNDISLAEGAFRTHLLGVRVEASFTRNLLTSAFLQYDSEGRLASTQVRMNYILRNIDNFYVVYNETRFSAGPFAGLTNRAIVSKITWSIYR